MTCPPPRPPRPWTTQTFRLGWLRDIRIVQICSVDVEALPRARSLDATGGSGAFRRSRAAETRREGGAVFNLTAPTTRMYKYHSL